LCSHHDRPVCRPYSKSRPAVLVAASLPCRIQGMMRTGLLVALLVACLALFWSERNPATRPVQADRISDAASPVPLAVPAAGGRAGVESAAATANPAVATDAAVELPDLASMAMHL